MQPTVPAWVLWYRRLRPAELAHAHERAAARSRAPNRLAVYTGLFNPRDEQNVHLIRLEDMLGTNHMMATPSSEWLKGFNRNNDIWRAQITPDLSKDTLEYRRFNNRMAPVSVLLPPSGAASVGGGGPLRGAGGALWGGWIVGVVLLLLLVLVVRAAEKCLDRRLFQIRRRQSEEWGTPNVMATSFQHQNVDVGSLPHLDDSEYSTPSHQTSDLPPPYYECALNSTNTNANKNLNKLSAEEPPPPYSACFVAFSNKDIPTVHIHTSTIPEPQTSSEVDNVHNDLIETRHRADGERNLYDDSTVRVELVFDNGRVVERTIAAENVPGLVVEVAESVVGDGPGDHIAYAGDGTDAQEIVIIV